MRDECVAMSDPQIAKPTRHNYRTSEIAVLFALPFTSLLRQAQEVHHRHHAADQVQLCSLLSIKTGGCREDCGYCPQSAHHKNELPAEPLLDLETITGAARRAKERGATRFCMGAAWRSPPTRAKVFARLLEAAAAVKELGLQVCMTLGMLDAAQARQLKQAGVYAYNHNLDTSPRYYPQVITTRTYADRLATLHHVRAAGMTVCCGGIVGMGEERRDRVALLQQLSKLDPHPESVPINLLVRVQGTPLAQAQDLDVFELVRTIATARIIMPYSRVRLSAGRTQLSDEAQALCFLAGANSIFMGEKLLTTANPDVDTDMQLLQRLGLRPLAST